MHLKIISIQRHPQKEIQSLEENYLKRLLSMIQVDLITIRPKTTADEKEKTLREEEKLIQRELANDENLVALDSKGKEFSTPELSHLLDKNMKMGTKSLVFLIGGPQGISENLMAKAKVRWSLSKLTFPHRLVRLIILEALYRSMDLLKGGPYHKALTK